MLGNVNNILGKMFNETQILRELNPVLRDYIVNSNCRELVDSGNKIQKFCLIIELF